MRILISLCCLIFPVLLMAQAPRLVVPKYHTGSVLMQLSRNKAYVATAGILTKKVKIWDYNSAKELATIPINRMIKDLAFSPDNRYLAVSAGNTSIIDLSSLKVISKIKGDAGSIHFSHDSKHLYFACVDREESKIYRSDLRGETQDLVFKLPTSKEIPPSFRLSDDGNYLYVRTKEKGRQIVNLNNVHEIRDMPNAIGFLPNGNILEQHSDRDKNETTLKAKDPKTEAIIWSKTVPSVSYGRLNFDYEAEIMSFHFPETQVFVSGNYKTGIFKVRENYPLMENLSSAALIGNDLLVHIRKPQNALKKLDPVSLQTKSQFGALVLNDGFSEIYFSKNAPAMVISSKDNQQSKQIRLDNGQINIRSFPGKVVPTAVSTSADGSLVLLPTDAEGIKVIKNGKEVQFLPFRKKMLKTLLEISPSEDGQYFALFKDDGVEVYQVGKNQPIFREAMPKLYWLSFVSMYFSKKQELLVHIRPSANDPNYKEEQLLCFDFKQKRLLWAKKSTGLSDFYITKDNELRCGHANEQALVSLDIPSAERVKFKKKQFLVKSTLWVCDYSPNGKSMLAKDRLNYKIYDLKTGNVSLRKKLQLKADLSYSCFLRDNIILVSTDQGDLILYDVEKDKEIGRLFFYANTDDWAVVTPEGLFDGSQNAIAQLYFVKGSTFLPLEQLYEQFYTPNLLSRLLNGEDTPAPTNIKYIKTPPSVQLNYRAGNRNLVVEDDAAEEIIKAEKEEAIIKVSAEAKGDQIKAIRLYHNGKLISNKTRGLVVEEDRPGLTDKSFTIQLLRGDNSFKAIAVNSQGTESSPALLRINYTPAVNNVQPPGGGLTLHLLAVGINQYKNSKYNLNYALADATAFKAAIAKGTQGITTDVKVHFISDAEASKGSITAAFSKVQSAAQPQDIFLFYYAGHGVMGKGKGSTKEDFYLVPHDITQVYGNDQVLQTKGISATELKSYASAIKAQKQLFILDACQSAGAVQTVAMRGMAEEKAIAQLARSTGTHWITASGSEQYATEFAQLGHGVFTYAILQGLKGKADSGDKRVTVNELKAWVESEVPELTQKYKGTPQYPASYGFGQDFPIGIVKQ